MESRPVCSGTIENILAKSRENSMRIFLKDKDFFQNSVKLNFLSLDFSRVTTFGSFTQLINKWLTIWYSASCFFHVLDYEKIRQLNTIYK